MPSCRGRPTSSTERRFIEDIALKRGRGLAPLVLRLGPREAVLYRADRDGGADPSVVARAALPARRWLPRRCTARPTSVRARRARPKVTHGPRRRRRRDRPVAREGRRPCPRRLDVRVVVGGRQVRAHPKQRLDDLAVLVHYERRQRLDASALERLARLAEREAQEADVAPPRRQCRERAVQAPRAP